LIAYVDGHPRSVITADVESGLITRLYVVTNPEKLRGIPDLDAVN
jgi:hypothetical protein